LFYFLVWRDIKTRYAQSAIGIGWAVIQPVFFMIVFTFVFGSWAKVESDGAPYAIFSYTALVPWVYFSTAVQDSSSSLIKGASLLSKVYFPRLIMPISSALAKLVDFSIAFAIVIVLMIWYQIVPDVSVLVLPLLVLIMVVAVTGIGTWLTSLAVQYRDIPYAMPFGVQLMMMVSPVVYPSSLIPDQYRLFYAINPMVGVIEGFRSALLGNTSMPWDLIAVSGGTSLVIAVGGILYFRRMERTIADVV
jgi:lipopolysaccharide transport system permease protein